MKKILSVLLCVCMLATTVALFSSCSFGGSKKVELVDYNLVYADDLSDTSTAYVQTLQSALQKKTSFTFSELHYLSTTNFTTLQGGTVAVKPSAVSAKPVNSTGLTASLFSKVL